MTKQFRELSVNAVAELSAPFSLSTFKKNLMLAAVSVLTLFSAPIGANAADAGDKISSFDTVMVLGKDASLNVAESINVDFGSNSHHGIYRFIPCKTIVQGRKMSCHISSKSASCDNSPCQSEVSMEGDNFKIRLGDPTRLLSGRHTFRIEYEVGGAVRLSKNNPELYWNVTGNGWKMPIESAKATLCLPDTIQTSQVKATCFKGETRSKQNGITVHCKENIELSATNLAPGQGLTLAAQLPENSVKIPGLIDEWLWNLEQGALGLTAIVALCFGWWPLALLLGGLMLFRGLNVENANWDSSGGSSLDFGSSGGGFGGGGGDTW
jgi:hypothetical protein